VRGPAGRAPAPRRSRSGPDLVNSCRGRRACGAAGAAGDLKIRATPAGRTCGRPPAPRDESVAGDLDVLRADLGAAPDRPGSTTDIGAAAPGGGQFCRRRRAPSRSPRPPRPCPRWALDGTAPNRTQVLAPTPNIAGQDRGRGDVRAGINVGRRPAMAYQPARLSAPSGQSTGPFASAASQPPLRRTSHIHREHRGTVPRSSKRQQNNLFGAVIAEPQPTGAGTHIGGSVRFA
jgi:hypothetical protein